MSSTYLQGFAPALIDLLEGRVALIMDILPSHIQTLEPGEAVGLALGQKVWSPLASKIPTFTEEGIASLDSIYQIILHKNAVRMHGLHGCWVISEWQRLA